MDLYLLGRLLHSAVGVVALGAFWVAALAVKGGPTHRRAGRVYLLGLMGVMTMSTLMVAGKVVDGEVGMALYVAFLISMIGTSSWLSWFSIRYRRDAERLIGPAYRILASWLVVMGGAMFAFGVSIGRPTMTFISLLGVGFGANMWRLALARERDGRWWLAQHMNGATLNFIATHDSLLALAVGSVVPALRQPVPRMLVAVGVTATALALRTWLGRRHLGVRAPERAVA